MKNLYTFEEFVNESKIGHSGVEKAAMDLAYSMPNHTAPDENGKFSEEQIVKAIKKYSPYLTQHMKVGMKDQIISRIQEILNESMINEEATTSWSKMMKGVRSGSSPFTIVAIDRVAKKVVGQEIVNIRDAVPAHYEGMKNRYAKFHLHIEDSTGKVVWTEK
jgi:hypothetical protein